ncbi:putative Zinc finger protein [Helianthus annuus]|nr:putative Zinc finger protein [Helianthus annuus]
MQGIQLLVLSVSRVYPTSRLLGIHVSEAHDSFFQAKVARGYAMYDALLRGCGMKLKSYKSRHQHLMDKHNFLLRSTSLKRPNHQKKKDRRKTNVNNTMPHLPQKMKKERVQVRCK